MDERITLEQARAIASLLPTIMRQLFTGDDPAEDLPLAQLRVCSILEHGPRSMSTLSRELGVSLSALTQIADRLERAELVSRVAEENDRRIRCLQLSQHGQRIMRHREEFRVRQVLAVLNQIPPTGRMQIREALEILLEARVNMNDHQASVSCSNAGL
jgi:DNA-binding MarR family transcriptional regulator